MSPTLPPPTLSAGLVTPPVPVVVLCRERAVTNMASDLFIVKMPDVRSCITFGSSCCRWAYGVKPTCALFRWIDPPTTKTKNKKSKKEEETREPNARAPKRVYGGNCGGRGERGDHNNFERRITRMVVPKAPIPPQKSDMDCFHLFTRSDMPGTTASARGRGQLPNPARQCIKKHLSTHRAF